MPNARENLDSLVRTFVADFLASLGDATIADLASSASPSEPASKAARPAAPRPVRRTRSGPTRPTATPAPAPATGTSVRTRILGVLGAAPLSTSAIAAAVGVPTNHASATLGKMVKKGEAKQTGRGVYVAG